MIGNIGQPPPSIKAAITGFLLKKVNEKQRFLGCCTWKTECASKNRFGQAACQETICYLSML